MNDFIVQVIYLPVTLVMVGLEVLGKAVAALQAPASTGGGTIPPKAPISGPVAAPVATPKVSGSAATSVPPVSYHPNALKQAPAAS